MKKFLSKIVLISATLLFIYLGVFYSLKYRYTNTINLSDIIILGDSHTEYLSMPNTFNYSFPGSPYIVHYNFIKEFKENIRGKTVLISYSPNNISNYKTYRFENLNFRPDWLSMVNRKLNSFNLYSSDYYKQYKWFDSNSNTFNSNRFKTLIFENKNNTGIFYEFNNEKLKSVILKHYSNNLYFQKDIYELKYLKKSIDLLKKINCKIILLNTIKTKEYNSKIPLINIIKYDSVLNNLKSEYYDLKYLDLNLHLSKKYNNFLFKDADHTNSKGDSITAKYLTNYINL